MNRQLHVTALGLVCVVALLAAPLDAAARRPFNCDSPTGTSAYSCYGATRARALLVRDLAAGEHVRDVASLSADLNIADALPLLRNLLVNPSKSVWEQGYAARALAVYGDQASAQALAKMARQHEGTNSTLWEAAFESLVEVDLSRAVVYSLDAVKRRPALTSTWDQSIARAVVPVLVETDTKSARVHIGRWAEKARKSGGSFFFSALLQSAHLRLGDEAALAKMRKALGVRNGVVPAQPEYYVAALGDHPGDVPALLRFASSTSPEARKAYDAIDRLVPILDASSAAPAKRARAALLAGLIELTAHRENRSHIQFEARQLARHHASLARLGHEPSKRRLLELTKEGTTTVIPWIAAREALEQGLPGAADATVAVWGRGLKSGTQLWETRISLLETASAVMGAADGRWAVAALDCHGTVRRRAVRHLSRVRPTGAAPCDAVLAAAPAAMDDGIDDGLLALTVLGNRCRPQLEAILPRRDVDPRLWGVSLEVLAMMRSPQAQSWATKVRFRRHLAPFAQRALAIAASPL